MIVPVKKHKHTYKIIGTAHAWKDSVMGFIMCDVICDKCGKTVTVDAYDEYEKQIMNWAAKGEYFNVPDECVLDEKTYKEYKSVVQCVKKGLLKGGNH